MTKEFETNFSTNEVKPAVPESENYIYTSEKSNDYYEDMSELYNKNVELAKQKAEERRKSMIDPLTGSHSIRRLDEYIEEDFDPNYDDNRVAVCYFDLNKFKEINDSMGHTVGDKLLIDFANYLNSVKRKGDILIRNGGDEFMSLCFNKNLDEGFEEHIYNKMKQISENSPVSVSFGVGVFNKSYDNLDFKNTIHYADLQMYRNKNGWDTGYLTRDEFFEEKKKRDEEKNTTTTL